MGKECKWSCCCDDHSTEASYRIWGEGVIGNSPKSDPSVAKCCKQHGPGWVKRNNPGRIRVAWTILKLKVTRFVLAVLLRIHLRHELKKRKL